MQDRLVYDLRPIGESITALERKVADLTRRLDEQPALTNPLAQAAADIDDLKAIVQQHKDWLDRLGAQVNGEYRTEPAGRGILSHSHVVKLTAVKQ